MSDTKHGISEDELKLIAAKKKEYMDAAAAGNAEMQDLAREYHDTAIDILLGDHIQGLTPIPGPGPGCGADPDPENTHIKEGGWGADMASPELWKVVPMKDDPNLWKIVDDDGDNVAHKFATEQEAKDYVKYYQCKKEQGLPLPTPEPGPGPQPEPGPAPTTDGPYPVKGQKNTNYEIRRAIRHYASGADDDETIEANLKNIKWRRHQFIIDAMISEMEHDDNWSMKLGGTHMGTGWFDHSVSIYKGRTGLGKEEDHPSTDLFVKEGKAIGDIRNKRMQVAATYDADANHTELWTNLGQGWVKHLEATDLGGFNPKASTFECQLRIDGFKKGSQEGKKPEPEIYAAWVSEY